MLPYALPIPSGARSYAPHPERSPPPSSLRVPSTPSTSATPAADAALRDGGGAASPAAGDAHIAMLV